MIETAWFILIELQTEYHKLNQNGVMRASVFIQLTYFPTHYLVVVITDEEFRYALIETTIVTDAIYASSTMDDIGWLDVHRLLGDDNHQVTDIDRTARQGDGMQQGAAQSRSRCAAFVPDILSQIYI